MRLRTSIIIIFALLAGAYQILAAQESNPLDQYVQRALSSNLTIKQTLEHINELEAAKNEARSRFFPVLDFNARYSRQGGGREVLIDPSNFIESLPPGVELGEPSGFSFLREREHDTRFNLIQPIFTGGKISSSYDARSMELRAAESNLVRVKEDIVFSVRQAYYQYAMADELVSIAVENRQLAREHLEVAQKLFEAERVAKNEVLRAEVGVSRAEQAVSEAENSRELARLYFNKLLDYDSENEIELPQNEDIADTSEIDKFADKTIQAYKEVAYDSRAELREIQYNIDAVGYLKKVHRSDYFPQISFSATYGWEGRNYNFDLQHDYWNLSLLLKFNILSFGARGARMDQAQAQINRLEFAKSDLLRAVDLQVSEAYYNLKNSLAKWYSAMDQLRSSEENYRMTEVQYENGLASQISFLDAQNAYTSARSNLVIVYYEILTASAALDHACGTGLSRYAISD
jgi:outer membrane protein TolC